jgi:hypothetical protein
MLDVSTLERIQYARCLGPALIQASIQASNMLHHFRSPEINSSIGDTRPTKIYGNIIMTCSSKIRNER